MIDERHLYVAYCMIGKPRRFLRTYSGLRHCVIVALALSLLVIAAGALHKKLELKKSYGQTVSTTVTILSTGPSVITQRSTPSSLSASAISPPITDDPGSTVTPPPPSSPDREQPMPRVVGSKLAKPQTSPTGAVMRNVPSVPSIKSIFSEARSLNNTSSSSGFPQTAGGTTSIGAVVIDTMAHAEIRQLSNISSIAQMYGVSEAGINGQMDSARQDVAGALGPIANRMMTKTLTEPLVMNIAAVANRVPQLAHSLERADFLERAMEVVGKESIAAAAIDPVHAAVLTATIVSHAFGQPVERDQIAAAFPQLSKALFEQEKRVMTEGIFQKMFGRNPQAPSDWKVVKQLAYGVNITDRNIPKEQEAQQRYEAVYGVQLDTLKNSSSAEDHVLYGQAIKMLQVVGANNLTVTVSKPQSPVPSAVSLGQRIKALFRASIYGLGR